MKDQNTWLIFGCSPQINDIKELIPALQARYTNVGINSFCVYHPACDYWIFNDSGFENVITKHYKGQKLLINEGIKSTIRHIETSGIPVYKTFKRYIEAPIIEDKGILYGLYNTSIQAAHYAIINGAKKVVLLGIENSVSGTHFYNENLIYEKSIEQVNSINRQFQELNKLVPVYKTTNSQYLNLDYINVTDLLKA
jgi:hypothetical protein